MLCYKEIVEFDPFKIPCLQQGHIYCYMYNYICLWFTVIKVTYIHYLKYI